MEDEKGAEETPQEINLEEGKKDVDIQQTEGLRETFSGWDQVVRKEERPKRGRLG